MTSPVAHRSLSPSRFAHTTLPPLAAAFPGDLPVDHHDRIACFARLFVGSTSGVVTNANTRAVFHEPLVMFCPCRVSGAKADPHHSISRRFPTAPETESRERFALVEHQDRSSERPSS